MQTSLMGTSVSLPVVLLRSAVLGEYHHHPHIRHLFEINKNHLIIMFPSYTLQTKLNK